MLHFRMDMPLYLMALYGSVMILIVLLLRGFLKNRLPKFVFPILWGLVLVRMLVPFSLSSPLSVPVPEWDLIGAEVAPVTVVENVAEAAPVTVVEDVNAAPISGAAEYSTAYSEYSGFNWVTVWVIVICIGVIVTAAILFSQKWRYDKKLRNSLLIEHNDTINTILRSEEMGHVLVFTNDHIASPLVSGVIHPRIYLPSGMDFQNVQLLRYILTHETMHIKRNDNLTKAIMLLTICLHWYNPLVWVMSKFLSADIEAACDAAVLKNGNPEERQSYAHSLLAMAITGNRKTLLYSAFSKTEVERRICSVLQFKKTTSLVLMLTTFFMLGSTVVFATAGQAPFSDYLSSYCGSSNGSWAARAVLERDIALDENANKRADDTILGVLHDDKTHDPDLLRQKITDALAKEFGVEKGAFKILVSFSPDDQTLDAEYTAHGITKDKDGWHRYQGEPVRSFVDEMPGVVQTRDNGTVDITVLRDRMGKMTSVTALHEGDTAFDERTEEIKRNDWGWTAESGTASTAVEQAVTE